MDISRRSMIEGISALAAASSLNWLQSAEDDSVVLPSDLTILFQGDSITDAGRNRGAYYPNNGKGMGQGFVRHIVTELLGKHPGKNLKIYNRGISGNKVFQLRDRWSDDCIMLQPDVLSIMIGVNDFWHTLNKYKGTVEIYEHDYMALIEQTKNQLPDVQLIIMEPFVLHDGTSVDADKWRGVFEHYQASAKRVANRFGATFIPLQSIFDQALNLAPTSYWCPDGVHPSMAGGFLMAKEWMSTFNQLMK